MPSADGCNMINIFRITLILTIFIVVGNASPYSSSSEIVETPREYIY